MKYTLSRKIVKKALRQELSLENIEDQFLLVTHIENIYTSIIEELKRGNPKKAPQTLKNIKKAFDELNADLGYYDQVSNLIKIDLDQIRKSVPNKSMFLFSLLQTTFHEYHHQQILNYQLENPNINLEYFILILEDLLAATTPLYKTSHDDFYTEILADQYGIEKTKNFLMKYPKVYQKLSGYIQDEELYNQIYFINYDIEKFINYLTKKISGVRVQVKGEYLNVLLDCLYTEDNKFRTIEHLFSNPMWNTLTLDVQYTIISSKSYLNSLEIETLSQAEREFVLEAIEYSYQKEQMRFQQNTSLRTKIQEFNQKIRPSLEYDIELFFPLYQKVGKNQKNLIYLENKRNLIKSPNLKLKKKMKSSIS